MYCNFRTTINRSWFRIEIDYFRLSYNITILCIKSSHFRRYHAYLIISVAMSLNWYFNCYKILFLINFLNISFDYLISYIVNKVDWKFIYCKIERFCFIKSKNQKLLWNWVDITLISKIISEILNRIKILDCLSLRKIH
jgi:hypothetical protein